MLIPRNRGFEVFEKKLIIEQVLFRMSLKHSKTFCGVTARFAVKMPVS